MAELLKCLGRGGSTLAKCNVLRHGQRFVSAGLKASEGSGEKEMLTPIGRGEKTLQISSTWL